MDNKNINELSENLPDYIEGRLDDVELVNRIESEISQNSMFRAEYEDLKTAFGFLHSTELSSPPDSYFNNLLPKINERISAIEEVRGENLLTKILSYWKVLIPVVPILLIFFVYKTYFMNPGTTVPVKETTPPVVQTEKIPEKEIPQDNTMTEVPDKNTMESATEQPRYDYTYSYPAYTDVTTQPSNSELSTSSETEIETLLESNPYTEETQDEYSDFDELDEDQQDDILTKLQNTDL